MLRMEKIDQVRRVARQSHMERFSLGMDGSIPRREITKFHIVSLSLDCHFSLVFFWLARGVGNGNEQIKSFS